MNRFAFLATAALVVAAVSPAQAWNPSTTCPNGSAAIWQSESTTWHLSDKYSGSNNFYSSLSDTAVENAVIGGWDVWVNPSTCGSKQRLTVLVAVWINLLSRYFSRTISRK